METNSRTQNILVLSTPEDVLSEA